MPENGRRVLIVDDDILVRKMLNEFLIFFGYSVDSVASGEDALKSMETGCYDVLITDYMMPGINGIELIRRVRDKNLSLQIIAVSASGEEKDFLHAGANFFIAKPFSLDALKKALEGRTSTQSF